MRRVLCSLAFAFLVHSSPAAADIIYSQTSLAGSAGASPGLFDQMGLLGGPDSERNDWYEIFTNNTNGDVLINRVTVYGNVSSPSVTAVLVPVMIGPVLQGVPNVLIPDTAQNHILASAALPLGPGAEGPIAVTFAPPVRLAQGAQLAFGVVVPLTHTVDADFWGTDTLPNGLSTTRPSYWTGFYASNNVFGLMSLSVGNHYLVVEGAPVPVEQIVDIDIRPGKMPNTINVRSHRKIPVAILSSSTFDAPSQVDTASLTFGHTGNEASLAFCEGGSKDVNDDGLLDMVCRFSIHAAAFLPGDTQGVLRGKTLAGVPIKGTDSVRIVHDGPEEADLESEADR